MPALSAPLVVDLNVTQRCNLDCDFCYAVPTNKLREMSSRQFHMLLEDLDRMNVLKVNITGGEPLLRKDIGDFLTILAAFDFVKSLNTNGTLVREDMAERIADVGFRNVGVSIDGPNETVYAANRNRKDHWRRALNGIRLLRKAGVPVHCTITLTRHNIGQIAETLQLAADNGITLVGLQFVCPSTVKGHESMPSHEDWQRAFGHLTDLKLAGRLPCEITFNPPNESDIYWELYLPLARLGRLGDLKAAWGIDPDDYVPSDYVSCQAGKLTCAIAANGDVYSCEMYMNWPNMRVANVFETPFSEIWHRTFVPLEDIRKSDLEGPCGSCREDYCGGGCRASAFHFTGKTTGSDLRCPIASEAVDTLMQGTPALAGA